MAYFREHIMAPSKMIFYPLQDGCKHFWVDARAFKDHWTPSIYKLPTRKGRTNTVVPAARLEGPNGDPLKLGCWSEAMGGYRRGLHRYQYQGPISLM